MYHEKTKHMDVRYHLVQEIISKGEILINKIGTADNLANILTQPLPIAKFKHCLILVAVSY